MDDRRQTNTFDLQIIFSRICLNKSWPKCQSVLWHWRLVLSGAQVYSKYTVGHIRAPLIKQLFISASELLSLSREAETHSRSTANTPSALFYEVLRTCRARFDLREFKLFKDLKINLLIIVYNYFFLSAFYPTNKGEATEEYEVRLEDGKMSRWRNFASCTWEKWENAWIITTRA